MKPEIVSIKAKDLLLEVVGNNQIDAIKFKAEHNWLGSLQADKIQLSSGRPVINQFGSLNFRKKNFQNGGKGKIKSQSSSMERQKEIYGMLGQLSEPQIFRKI